MQRGVSLGKEMVMFAWQLAVQWIESQGLGCSRGGRASRPLGPFSLFLEKSSDPLSRNQQTELPEATAHKSE
jgi:hypothetical protein